MNTEFKLGIGLDKDGRIASDLTQLVGNTPMLSLGGFCRLHSIECDLVAKLEYFNPLGSAKDRVGLEMLTDAENRGVLKSGGCIIEPTSGNTGVGLSFAAAIKGYKIILTMPENMSIERVKLLKMLGAEVVLTPAADGMQGAIDKAHELAAEIDSAFIPDQFRNPANANAHRKTTAPEILRDTYGKIDCFVAGVGTGGTLTGVGEVLKAYRKDIKVIAVEPMNSAVLSGGKKGSHGLMGIGAGFIPEILNTGIIDEIERVTDEEAYEAAREVAKTDGLLVGISSGAALHAAKKAALGMNDKHKRIVVLLPDGGERYMSTPLFDI